MKRITVHYQHRASLRRAAGVGALAALGLVLLGAVPAFAWTSSLTTTSYPSTSVLVGATIHDIATLNPGLVPPATTFGPLYSHLYPAPCTALATPTSPFSAPVS